MLKSRVFLGVKELPALQAQLKKKSPQFLELFIQDDPDYLQRVEHQGQPYLGKFLDSHVDLSHLDLIESNVYSLLRRVVPEYPFQESILELFPVTTTE